MVLVFGTVEIKATVVTWFVRTSLPIKMQRRAYNIAHATSRRIKLCAAGKPCQKHGLGFLKVRRFCSLHLDFTLWFNICDGAMTMPWTTAALCLELFQQPEQCGHIIIPCITSLSVRGMEPCKRASASKMVKSLTDHIQEQSSGCIVSTTEDFRLLLNCRHW